MTAIIGWDIGGANVKASWRDGEPGREARTRVVSHPFEIWRERDRLADVLKCAAAVVSCGATPGAMATTMTAELSDVFSTKREGVLFVVEALERAFPDTPLYGLDLSGEMVALEEATERPLAFAAANWLASALWIAEEFQSGLLVDVGSTTTDIVPILNGRVVAEGRTDMERLASGELVFTGVLRTNLAAIVQSVPVAGKLCRVASECFAVSGDVHLILGDLKVEEYTCSTPDGRPPSLGSARGRLARLVCADVEMLSSIEIEVLARRLRERQVAQIRDGMEQVIAGAPILREHPVLLLGAGAFLGAEAASVMGLESRHLSLELGERAKALPCLAAAHLLARRLQGFA